MKGTNVGVSVYIDDDHGHTYRALGGADSKRFAQLLIHPRFWTQLEAVFQVTTHPVTFIVAEQVVPDDLADRYPSWQAYYTARFQPIQPLLQTLEHIQSALDAHPTWFHIVQQQWYAEETDAYHVDAYLTEGGWHDDLASLRTQVQAIEHAGVSELCIYLL